LNLHVRLLWDRPQRGRFNAKFRGLSEVVLYELFYGAESSNDVPRILCGVEHFAGRLTVLPFDSEAAAHIIMLVNSDAMNALLTEIST
jgi:tRNA(fMet)-specific endonuclease VapC